MAAACTPEPEAPSPIIKVTASSATVEYGDPIPDITPSYSSSTPPAVPATCSTTATQSSPPGVYPTVCEGASDPSRAVTYQDGTITIKPAPVTVTASSAVITVGEAVPAVTATYDGLKLGATQPATLATCSTEATASSPAGTYATTCSGAADDNYTFSYVNGTLEIASAVVTVTASSGTHVYGADAPAITATYSGFKHGETAPATPAVCESASDATSPVGTYASTCSGAADPSYSFVYVDGTVEVTPAPLTITASSAAMLTGEASPTITPIYSGLVNGDAAPAVPPTCSTTAGPSSAAGTYPSSCSGASDPNYSIAYVDGTVTVTASTAPVVVTASSATVEYGDPIPAITPSYSGLVGGSPATPPVCSTTATSASGVGTYETTCSGAVDPAYTFTYVSGSITIVPADVTVEASSATMTYGGAVPTISASYSGLKNGQSAPANPATCSTAATSSSPVGSYTSSCSGASDPNYSFNYADGTVTIDEAAVVVTASDATFEEGGPVPTISPSYSGFLFGETGPATAPVCGTDATASSAPGTYGSSCSGASDPNYSFTYVDGVVTVTPAAAPSPSATGYAGYSTVTKATTITAPSNGKTLPQGNIDVASVAGFETYTNLTVVTSNGPQNVFCNGFSATNSRFQGCSGGSGTMSTGALVTDGAMNTFDVYTIMGGASSVEPSSLTIITDVPAAFRGMPAQVNANSSHGLITSLITPAATGNFNLLFGICDKGTATYSAANPACKVGELVYGPGAISNMGAEVKVSVPILGTITSNVYQKVHTALTAPATVAQGDTVTVYAAPAGSAIPKTNPSSAGDATVNHIKDVSIVFPLPTGMEFVEAAGIGGDARTSGKLQVKYCPTSSTSGCTAKLTGNYDQTTLPYVQVSMPGVQVPGGTSMTVPTVAFKMRATGAPGTIAKATLTQFNLTTNVKPPIVGATDAKFEGYPTTGDADVKPPKAPPAVLGTIEITD